MQPGHAKPTVAFCVLVVLAAATIGSGMTQAPERDVVAAVPSADRDRSAPFDPAEVVTLGPRRAGHDSAPGGEGRVAPGSAEAATLSAARSVRPDRGGQRSAGSQDGDGGGIGSGAGSGATVDGDGSGDGSGGGGSGGSGSGSGDGDGSGGGDGANGHDGRGQRHAHGWRGGRADQPGRR